LGSGQIIEGTKPGDLPLNCRPGSSFIINLKAAKALGLTVPATLLAHADEVIE
jgi:putative tryptophan/tyrosine transport system substrate-binding protein